MIRRHGRIKTTEFTPPESLRNRGFSWVQHVWRPSRELQSQLPANFALQVCSITDRSGTRRFLPFDWKNFPLLAACGGLAISQATETMESERTFTFRLSLLMYQLHARLPHALTRVFVRGKDLYCSSSTSEDGFGHILPENLQLETSSGHSPTPNDVIESGRSMARSQNLPVGDEGLFIRLALDDAARRDPVCVEELTVAGQRPVVRLGLFDLGPATERVSQAVLDEVIHRFTESLEKHIELPTAAFNDWFFASLDNIVKQVSERKREIGRVDRQVVRQIILEQVFESYVHLAGLIEAQMQAFADALLIPLTQAEATIFDALYTRQRWLGGLSVALLAGQFPLLQTLLGELIAEPSIPARQGAVLRRLLINAEMIRRKRAADREDQRRRRRSRSDDPVVLRDPAAEPQTGILEEIAAEFRERRNATCPCRSLASWYSDDLTLTADKQHIEWNDCCADCKHAESVSVPCEDVGAVYHDLFQ